MPAPADHDLLFGVTAMQLRFVTQEQLVAATAELGDASQRTLRDRLCELKLLSKAEADAVAAVVRERLARFGNDPRQTLDSVGAAEAAALSRQAAGARTPRTTVKDGFATRDDQFATEGPRAWSYSPQHQRFTILRLHQQGGLGRLMIAQDEELNREIALKEILPAYADSEENRRRFIREAEITGALEHPGIVPVYSLGEFPDGRPYYAMRLIRGVDLRTAIEDFHSRAAGRAEKQLEFRQLLARFVTVCQAVDYAHNRGVLHRDLKPGNIMLGDYGETLVVDWGLAKTMDRASCGASGQDGRAIFLEDFEVPAVTPSNRAQSDRTQAGRIVGTTQYMSPEQAAGRIDRLSPASDIYGLGATLYHLLAGRPPFDGDDDDVVLRVQQGRFQRPREHARHVPRPLEAVCLKAMTKKPQDRYATAREMALDIERYLGDERVLAYAEPVTGRAWRWIRRHRTPVMSLMAAAAVAVAGLSFGVGLLKVQRDRAEHNFQLAQQAVRDYYIRVSEETLLNQPGMQPLRDSLLRQALVYFEQFLADRSEDPQLRREVAQAQFFVGRITETVDSPAKAIEPYEQAAGLQNQLLASAGAKDRESLQTETAQTLNALGRVYQNLQQLEKARAYHEQAAQLRVDLAELRPDDAEAARSLASSVMNLGLIHLMAGNAEAALPQLERAQAIRLAHADSPAGKSPKLNRDLGMGYYNLAQAQLAAGNLPAAETNLRAAISTFEALAEVTPTDFENRRRLAICYRMLGDANPAASEEAAEEAIGSYERAREALRELVAANPNVPDYAADLAGVQMNLAQRLADSGDTEAALAELQAAAEILHKLTAGGDPVPRRQRDLAVTLRTQGELLAQLDRREEARPLLEEAKTLLEALVRQHPAESPYAAELKLTADAIAALDAI